MKALAKVFAIVLAVCVLQVSAYATYDAPEQAITGDEYGIATYFENGQEKQCLTRTKTYQTPAIGETVHRVEYYIPVTEDQKDATERLASDFDSGITPFAYETENDDFYQCMFILEVVDQAENRVIHYDGKYQDFQFSWIKEVNYGHCPHPNGEGHVSVANELIEVVQAGYIDYPGTVQGHYEKQQNFISDPNGFGVRNENSLRKWTPPTSWKAVADMSGYGPMCLGGHYTAKVTNTVGQTCNIDLVCTAKGTPIF